MRHDVVRNNLEILYETVPEAEVYSNIVNDLAIFFKTYIKAKSPIIAGLSALKENSLIKIEEKRVNGLLRVLQEGVDRLDTNKIDYNFIRTEEFARIVFNLFDKARIDYREEKLKYYANILISYSTFEFSNDFYKEGIIEKIGRYSVEHILVLESVYSKHIEINNKNELDFDEPDNLCKDIMSKEIWDICVNTLKYDGFINKSFFGGYYIEKYGIRCVELIKNY